MSKDERISMVNMVADQRHILITESKQLDTFSRVLQAVTLQALKQGKRIIRLSIKEGDLIEVPSVLMRMSKHMEWASCDFKFIRHEHVLLETVRSCESDALDVNAIIYHGSNVSHDMQGRLSDYLSLLPPIVLLALPDNTVIRHWTSSMLDFIFAQELKWPSLVPTRRSEIPKLFEGILRYLVQRYLHQEKEKESPSVSQNMAKALRDFNWPKELTATDMLNVAIPFFESSEMDQSEEAQVALLNEHLKKHFPEPVERLAACK